MLILGIYRMYELASIDKNVKPATLVMPPAFYIFTHMFVAQGLMARCVCVALSCVLGIG